MYVEINARAGEMFPFAVITIGKNQQQARIERLQGFNIHQFLWVTEGEGVLIVDGQRRILSKGEGVFTRANISHTYYSSGGVFSTAWLTFQNGESLLHHYPTGDYFFFEVPAFLQQTTEQLEEICSSSRTLAERVAHEYLWATELFEAIFSGKQSFVQKVDAYLEQHYSEPISLDEIALYMHTDRYSLCRRYMKESQNTVMCRLRQLRIQKAKRILCYSDDSIETEGNMCGFDSASYFIKIFRQETGISPGKYRLRSKSN